MSARKEEWRDIPGYNGWYQISDWGRVRTWRSSGPGSRSFLDGCDPEADAVWEDGIKACDAAADILNALKTEGIQDGEQVRDLIADYNALAAQYQALHLKHEAAERPERLGGALLCPDCHRQTRPGNAYCWNCGKKLDWDR